MPFQPFNPDAEVRQFRNHLPHWRQSGVTYFVTTRLADSLPQNVLEDWRAERELWLRVNGYAEVTPPETLPTKLRAEYHSRFSRKFHELLDAGAGECWLRKTEHAAMVADALRHFDGERYELGDFVVMPNHLHVLVSPIGENELSDILHTWKRFTAQVINKLARRNGALWQAESFNHIVRGEEQLRRIQQYVAENPAKARLREGEYLLWKREA